MKRFRRLWKQEKIAQWIIDCGIGARITTKDVVNQFYGDDDEEKMHRSSEQQAARMLLEVFKNWTKISDGKTLLVRNPVRGAGLVYELVENNEENRKRVESSLIDKVNNDALRSQGFRKSNFFTAKNHGIHYRPSIDTLVRQIGLIGEKGTAEDKLRLVGAVSPQLLELAGLSHTNKQLPLGGSSKEH